MLTSLSLLVVIATLIGVAVGRVPYFRTNRATIALVGATVLLLLGALSLEEAYAALDMNTLVLLFSMMILNVNLRRAGFFNLVGKYVLRWAHTPRQLLGLIIFASGLLSAMFLNDTIVLVFTPLVLEIVLSLKIKPIPYLIGLVTAANIGSAGTITGNPQNMIVGIASGLPFVRFTSFLGPVALVGLAIAWLVIVLTYREDFRNRHFERVPETSIRTDRSLLRKSMLATGAMLVAFVVGVPVPLAALSAAAALLISRRRDPEIVFQELDWSLLVFFASLFIVTHSLEVLGVSAYLASEVQPLLMRGILRLTVGSVVLSNLVSNVPAVLLLRPFLSQWPNPEQAWLTVAMATTLAGNLTLLGSVANLIVAELARRRGHEISFGDYMRAGTPITLLTLTWGVLWLWLVF
jgi:Na+/H+ antiporter NhaD/arsenite permease-like protein